MSETKRTVEGRECCYCHRNLPLTYFPLKPGKKHARYKVCRDCLTLGHSCVPKVRPEPKRRKFASDEERQAAVKAYYREWRKKNADKLREQRRAWYYRKKGEEVPVTRVCTCCGKELPIDDFNDSAGRRSHSYECRECRQRKPLNPMLAPSRKGCAREKVCHKCGKLLPLTAFDYRKDGLYRLSTCRECRKGLDRSDMKAYIREVQRRRRERMAEEASKERKPRVGNGQGDRHEYHAQRYAEHKDEIKAKQVLSAIEAEKLKPKPKPAEKLCTKCWLYPCFEGIDNMDSDFAKEGCISFKNKEELQ